MVYTQVCLQQPSTIQACERHKLVRFMCESRSERNGLIDCGRRLIIFRIIIIIVFFSIFCVSGILSPPGPPFLTPSPSPSIPASPRLQPSPSQSPFQSDVIIISNNTNQDTVNMARLSSSSLSHLASSEQQLKIGNYLDFCLRNFRRKKRRRRYVVNQSIRSIARMLAPWSIGRVPHNRRPQRRWSALLAMNSTQH